MKKIFDYIKKHLVFSIIVVSVLIPVLIYFLTVIPILPSGNNDWAGFWGGYIGAIIGGICTVIGVYWTIEYSQENYKEDVRNRTLPYISLYALQQDIITDLLMFSSRQLYDTENVNSDNELNMYREYRLEKVFIVIENKEIKYKKELTERQEKLIQNGGLEEVHKHGVSSLIDRRIVSVPIELENVGNGVALQFRVGLYKIEEEKPGFVFPFDFKVGEKLCLHIFAENNYDSIGEYMLEVNYMDILNNSYCQKFEFNIKKNEVENKVFSTLDLSGKQIRE